ncbi:fungal-specific transcription factor domain-containing protein [Aspergillus karnatakaensis]|uniref:Zn(II)2Cys6 transcription factor n=1 Tax=Aspergillus karnatakaensis TaxID=1810916 RepID=UPI003CCCF589
MSNQSRPVPFRLDSIPRASLTVPRRTKRSNACLACRTRRIKCGGNEPCDNCAVNKRDCVFVAESDRRRRFTLRRAEQKLETAHQVLDNIVAAFNAGDRPRLVSLLLVAREYRLPKATHVGNAEQASETQTLDSESPLVEDSVGDSHAGDGFMTRPGMPHLPSTDSSATSATPAASVDFLEDAGTLTEDPNRDEASRTAGYFGKASDIAWLQRLGSAVNRLTMDNRAPHSFHIQDSTPSMNYHLGHTQAAETIPPPEPRCLPPKPWAAQLVGIFFKSVAPSFPVVNKSVFIFQFDEAFTCSTSQPSRKWLAVLNLILAVGSRCYQTLPASGSDVDDRVYLSRALALSPAPGTTKYLGLHQVQIELMFAIYYLFSGQSNQSWQANGRAARLAISIGLNLRVDGNSRLDTVSKETRARIWWSIVALENVLSSITGRVSCIDSQSMSVHLPLPYDEGQFSLPEVTELLQDCSLRETKLQSTIHASTSERSARDQWLRDIIPSQSLYFFHLIDLSITMQAATKALYSLTATKDSISAKIPFYQEKLQFWLSSLQPAFAFIIFDANDLGGMSAPNSREQVSLAMVYYSSQMILNRPCLTELDIEAGTNIKVPRSNFEDDTAKACVHFALALISVLPSKPDIGWIMSMTSWWLLLHTIMRALTILLTQLSIGLVSVVDVSGEQQPGEANPGEDAEAVREAAKKALFWLHSMAEQDPSSSRAFHIGKRLFHLVTPSQAWIDLQELSAESALLGAGHENEKQRAFANAQHGLNGFGTVSLNLPERSMNWGPDCTGFESGTEEVDPPLYLDPVLLSFDSYEF